MPQNTTISCVLYVALSFSLSVLNFIKVSQVLKSQKDVSCPHSLRCIQSPHGNFSIKWIKGESKFFEKIFLWVLQIWDSLRNKYYPIWSTYMASGKVPAEYCTQFCSQVFAHFTQLFHSFTLTRGHILSLFLNTLRKCFRLRQFNAKVG